MVNVNLHGEMAKEFESSWRLDVSCAAEVLRALDAQVPNFRKYLTENELKGHRYWMAVNGKKLLKEEEFFCKLPKDTKTIDFLPVVGGAAPLLPFLAKMILYVAIGTAIGMIIAKIFEPPDPQELKDTNSYLFAGAQNTESQGIPVPIAYGTLLLGGKVISAVHEYSDLRKGFENKDDLMYSSSYSNAWSHYKVDRELWGGAGSRVSEAAGSLDGNLFSDVFEQQRGLGGGGGI